MRSLRILMTALLVGAPVSLCAEDGGTPEEAKAMLVKAVAHYRVAGRTQALADFTAGKAPFKDRDLYVVCVGPDQRISANGGFPKVVGLPANILKDSSGKALGLAIIESVAAKNEGTVSYRMINPVSGGTEPKVLYVQKVGEDACGVGAYNPD